MRRWRCLVSAPFWQGIGVGAAITAVTGSVIDHCAQSRAALHLDALWGL
ncbi:hypothetical protein [Actinoplanes derwentensis]|nr:hypothetical protein [Actinoplanes derwentensis]